MPFFVLPAGTITRKTAARILGLTPIAVHALKRYGVLHQAGNKVMCHSRTKGTYPRKAVLFSIKEVLWWKRIRSGEIKAPEIEHAGKVWMPRALIAILFPAVLPYLNKRGAFGIGIEGCKTVPWPEGFRYHKRPQPMGYCKADVEKLDERLVNPPKSALEQVKDWLRKQLGSGRVKSADVHAAADRDEVSQSTLQKAREALQESGELAFERVGRESYWKLTAEIGTMPAAESRGVKADNLEPLPDDPWMKQIKEIPAKTAALIERLLRNNGATPNTPPEQMSPAAQAIAWMFTRARETGRVPTVPELVLAIPNLTRAGFYRDPNLVSARQALAACFGLELPTGRRDQDGNLEAEDPD